MTPPAAPPFDPAAIPAAALPALLAGMPKAELHVHIEGTLEPELSFALAARNGVALPYPSVEALRAAYAFSDLQSFLDLYYAGAAVLRTAQDFDQLASAYLQRAAADGVRHAEIFFDPQTHTARGVPFDAVFDGLRQAIERARATLGLSATLILCFLRHLDEAAAFATLEQALPAWRAHPELLVGVGLDSSERGHPPEKFARVFARCGQLGLRRVAHAGEEGPPAYIVAALDLLGAERIDHGVRCTEDPALVARLARERVPLTVCPLSNVRLRVFPRLADHNLRQLLDAGLVVTINSDDPSYFGGYLNDNLRACTTTLGLDARDLWAIARAGFAASFLAPAERDRHLAAVDACFAAAADG